MVLVAIYGKETVYFKVVNVVSVAFSLPNHLIAVC